MSEFKRERRYKIEKIGKPDWNKSCVVVEEDWPEYELVWNMIADRVNGDPYFFEETNMKLAECNKQVEQLQAELASVTASKEPKLPEWNDKEAEWQSYPPGATLMNGNGNGKVTIVKEKFYPADKELIEQLQAEIERYSIREGKLLRDNARLREEFDELTNPPIKWYVSERETRFVFATTDDRDEFVKYIIGVKALAFNKSS